MRRRWCSSSHDQNSKHLCRFHVIQGYELVRYSTRQTLQCSLITTVLETTAWEWMYVGLENPSLATCNNEQCNNLLKWADGSDFVYES